MRSTDRDRLEMSGGSNDPVSSKSTHSDGWLAGCPPVGRRATFKKDDLLMSQADSIAG